MTLTTDTQQIEHPLNGLLDKLSELLYSMAHDRADARELCDQRAIVESKQL